MPTDPFAGHSLSLTSPATRSLPIFPSDVPLALVPRAIAAAGDGFLAGELLDDPEGTTFVIRVLAGQVYHLRPRKVLPTTTATGLVGFL